MAIVIKLLGLLVWLCISRESECIEVILETRSLVRVLVADDEPTFGMELAALLIQRKSDDGYSVRSHAGRSLECAHVTPLIVRLLFWTNCAF